MSKILVTGGAGYIGSHTARMLLENNYNVIVFDNLSTGHKRSLPDRIDFIKGDLKNYHEICSILKNEEISAVMHFAANSLVGESMANPLKYYTNNLVGGINLLNAMRENKVDKLIFSSTAAVYGEPKEVPITEDSPLIPTNNYGKSKLMFETIIDSCIKHGIKSVCLRYFNAAGAGYSIGEDHSPETHLIPNVLKAALGDRNEISIFGNNYPTKDGTCIRDYVHVIDIAKAHILALKKLEKEEKYVNLKYNIGSETGYSVKEIIEASEKVIKKTIKCGVCPRRDGDPAVLIASSQKIKEELGWNPKYNLHDIIASAWEWHKNNPQGFKD